MFWGFAGLWFLLPLLFLGRLFWFILLALLIVMIVRRLSVRRRYAPYYQYHMPQSQPSALETLRQRYARGEIDEATYEQMRERLEAANAPKQQQ